MATGVLCHHIPIEGGVSSTCTPGCCLAPSLPGGAEEPGTDLAGAEAVVL